MSHEKKAGKLSEEGQRECTQSWNHVISGKWQDPFIHALKLAVTVTELHSSDACAFRLIIEPAPCVLFMCRQIDGLIVNANVPAFSLSAKQKLHFWSISF